MDAGRAVIGRGSRWASGYLVMIGSLAWASVAQVCSVCDNSLKQRFSTKGDFILLLPSPPPLTFGSVGRQFWLSNFGDYNRHLAGRGQDTAEHPTVRR